MSERFSSRSAAIAASRLQKGDEDLDQPFAAPIIVNGEQLATIIMEPAKAAPIRSSHVNRVAKKLGVPPEDVRRVMDALKQEGLSRRTASVQFLYLMANALSRFVPAGNPAPPAPRPGTPGPLHHLPDAQRHPRPPADFGSHYAGRGRGHARQIMLTAACLMNSKQDELVIKSVYGLSDEYLHKGQVLVRNSKIDRLVLSGQTVYIPNMATDPRVTYPAEAEREGIVSNLCTRLEYKGRGRAMRAVYTR